MEQSRSSIRAANIAALQTNAITAGAWFKTSSTATGGTIIAKTGAWQLALSRSTAGKLAIYNPTGDVDVCADATTVNDGAWHYAAMTMDSGVANGTKLYVDGTLKQTCTATVSNQTGTLTIGSLGASYYFNGMIDEAKVFNRIFSADEVKAEYDAGVAGTASGVSLGTIVPSVSNSVSADMIVLTDANNYTLSVSQDRNLTSGANTIPAISSGTIAVPSAWTEGTTKGLGFSLAATNATALPGKWSAGANFAPFPGTATSFYTRSGTQSSKDYITMKLRADAPATTVATATPYTNVVTITGTYVP